VDEHSDCVEESGSAGMFFPLTMNLFFFFADGGIPKIWIHVPNERKDKSQTVVHSIVEKKSMVNLTQAFSVAVKVRP
jgi:hypothetical protein